MEDKSFIAYFFLLSTQLKDYICITTFVKFQTPNPTHILNIFD